MTSTQLHPAPPSLPRSVSFSDTLAFQSPPPRHRRRRSISMDRTPLRALFPPTGPNPAPLDKKPSRRPTHSSTRASHSSASSHDRHRTRRHHRRHQHRHHHHRHHRRHHHHRADDKENAFAVAAAPAGATPRNRARALRPLQERACNVPVAEVPREAGKTAVYASCPNAHAHCCSRGSYSSAPSEERGDMFDRKVVPERQRYAAQEWADPAWAHASAAYNQAAQSKYTAQLQGKEESPTRMQDYPGHAVPFYPTLNVSRDKVVEQAGRTEELTPGERVAFIEQNGAKAHLHGFLMLHLQLPPDEGWEDMLHGLDGAQLHALYILARKEPCGFALLRRAEAEEREVAKLQEQARRGMGKYAIARIVADERRHRRIARLSLKRFLESEGGRWTEEQGIEKAVIAMGERIVRLQDFHEVAL